MANPMYRQIAEGVRLANLFASMAAARPGIPAVRLNPTSTTVTRDIRRIAAL